MKKICMVALMVMVFYGIGNTQVMDLNTSETLAVPTATRIDLRNIGIDITTQRMTVTYRFLTSTGLPIPGNDYRVDRYWTCENRTAQLAANCTGIGQPYPGCTGVGTGKILMREVPVLQIPFHLS